MWLVFWWRQDNQHHGWADIVEFYSYDAAINQVAIWRAQEKKVNYVYVDD